MSDKLVCGFVLPEGGIMIGELVVSNLEQDIDFGRIVNQLRNAPSIQLKNPIVVMSVINPQTGQPQTSTSEYMPFRKGDSIYLIRCNLPMCEVNEEVHTSYERFLVESRARKSNIVLPNSGGGSVFH